MSVSKLFDSDRRVLTLQQELSEVIEHDKFNDLSVAQVIGVLEIIKLNMWKLIPEG